MDASFGALGAAVKAGVIAPTGPAFSRYDSGLTDVVDIEVGFPVDVPLQQDFRSGDVIVVASELPAGLLAITKYRGGYDRLGEAWAEFLDGVNAEGYEPLLPFWEAYDTQPTPDMDPETLITGLATLVRKAS